MAHWAPRKRQLSTPVVKPGAGKTDEPKFPEANAVECHNSWRPRPYRARESRGLPRKVCATVRSRLKSGERPAAILASPSARVYDAMVSRAVRLQKRPPEAEHSKVAVQTRRCPAALTKTRRGHQIGSIKQPSQRGGNETADRGPGDQFSATNAPAEPGKERKPEARGAGRT